jgi:hypothetical protein
MADRLQVPGTTPAGVVDRRGLFGAEKVGNVQDLVQPLAGRIGQIGFGKLTVEFYGFAQGVYHDTALFTGREVALDFGAELGRSLPIEEVG